MKQFAAVFFGGALGTLFRFLLNEQAIPFPIPYWTWLENTAGSLILGIVTGFYLFHSKKTALYAFLGAGFCGGFTTMSAFVKETLHLMYSGSPMLAAGYMAATVTFGLLAAWLGILIGRNFASKRKERITP